MYNVPEKKRDLSSLPVLSSWKGTGCRYTRYLANIGGDDLVEKLTIITECEFTKNESPKSVYSSRSAAKAGEYIYTKSVQTSQRMLCIGGPMDGLRRTRQSVSDDYVQYNCSMRLARKKKDDRYHVVLIYMPTLKG